MNEVICAGCNEWKTMLSARLGFDDKYYCETCWDEKWSFD